MTYKLPLLALGILVVLAGCAGTPAQPSVETAASTPTAEQVTEPPTQVTTTDASTETTVSTPPTAEPTETTTLATVEYGALQAPAQRVFRWAVENGSVHDLRDVDSEAFRALVVNDCVRYQGSSYGVSAWRDLHPQTVLLDVRQTSEDAITETDFVVTEANLSAAAKADIQAVRNGSESSVAYEQGDAPFPAEPLDEPSTYVRANGTVYRLELAHGDVYGYHLTLEHWCDG